MADYRFEESDRSLIETALLTWGRQLARGEITIAEVRQMARDLRWVIQTARANPTTQEPGVTV